MILSLFVSASVAGAGVGIRTIPLPFPAFATQAMCVASRWNIVFSPFPRISILWSPSLHLGSLCWTILNRVFIVYSQAHAKAVKMFFPHDPTKTREPRRKFSVLSNEVCSLTGRNEVCGIRGQGSEGWDLESQQFFWGIRDQAVKFL